MPRQRKNITLPDSETLRGLGVFLFQNTVYLYFQATNDAQTSFQVATSSDGFGFESFKQNLNITRQNDSKQLIAPCSNFVINDKDKQFEMLYKQHIEDSFLYMTAASKDLFSWKGQGTMPWSAVEYVPVPEYMHHNQSVMYVSSNDIYVAFTNDNGKSHYAHEPLLSPREDMFDKGPLSVAYVQKTDKGILLVYHSKLNTDKPYSYAIGAAIFDSTDPSKLLWRANEPLWDTSSVWKNVSVEHIGIVNIAGQLISYWNVGTDGIFAVLYALHGLNDGVGTKNVSLRLKKSQKNPLISPKSDNSWEAFTTFNPAAFYDEGKVHLLYRAQGFDYISVLGYAASKDGINIHQRSNDPVFKPSDPFDTYVKDDKRRVVRKFMSGGGYGGCEDPRITKIEDRIYMTYVAFDGYNPPRVALTSIAIEDFRNQRWLWERPVLISPPDVVDKNACIFPEKINEKYAILHRIYPDILIDFVDSLAFDGSSWLEGQHKISPRPDKWDSMKIGAGPPPIKTKDGWLLLYQAVGNQDSGRYKIGAMLLDLSDPTKVLHRSDAPILEPSEWYENEGFKSGVTYPCGAVVLGGILHVYYGGSDSHVCVATANLDDFLAELKHSELAILHAPVLEKVL